LAWSLGIAFLVVAVVPIVLFYWLDVEFVPYGDRRCIELNSDSGEASNVWWVQAFFVGPLAGGLIAYASVILFAPGRLGRTRWRFAFGLPVAAIVPAALFYAAISASFIYPSCTS
jgi:hypothetical protein